MDDYIALLKKYNDNPTDLSILSDYTEMIERMEEWSEKADNIEGSLENPDDLNEYIETYTRILKKLTDAQAEMSS
jgi:adenylosuccinate synthase